MTSFTRTTTRRLVAGVSVAALSASALAISSPAIAADPTVETVTAADIAPDATPYAGWHQGQAGATENHDVTADGLSLIGKSQVIKGYENNSWDLEGQNADLTTVLPEAEFTVTSGDVWFQVPLFFSNELNPIPADPEVAPAFTTLRPATEADLGANDIALTDEWISSRKLSDDVPAGTAKPLGDILAELDDYKTLAFGVFTDTNLAGSVSDITWDGTKYVFQSAAPTVANVTDSDVAPDESVYKGWHQGYADAADRHQVNTNGLKLTGSSQVINGYANNTEDVDAKNANLPFAVRNAAFTVTDGTVNFQIPVFFDNGAGVKFTTLRQATQQGVGTHGIKLDDEWISSGAVGSIAANTATPLSDLIAGLGQYKVLAFGVHQATTGSATVSDITWEGTKYVFNSVTGEPAATTVTEGDIRPDESTYEGWHQGYADAADRHRVTSTGGLELTGKSQVINGYADNAKDVDAKNVDLRQALLSASYTVNSGDVWFQVPLFFADASATDGIGFTTLRRASSVSAGTHVIDLDDEWTSSRKLGAHAANTPTRLGDLIAEIGAYKVLAFGVLTDAAGSISDITWDGTKYSFVNNAPVLADARVVTRVGVPVSIDLAPSDADGNTVKLSTSSAGATLVGTKLNVAVPKNKRAGQVIIVTADDERGGVTTARIEVAVAKAKTTVKITSPRKTKAQKRIKVKVTAKSTAVVKGARVDLFVGGKKVGTAKVKANGKATITSKKLSKKLKGNRKVFVRFRATSVTSADKSNVRKIRIR